MRLWAYQHSGTPTPFDLAGIVDGNDFAVNPAQSAWVGKDMASIRQKGHTNSQQNQRGKL
ncbi:MAG: hypothetical protein Q8L02_08155 [Candidatus Nitrotoga sp.]|nr:hypothetical protein [Candidatus Nitrotoga sp.]